MTEPALLMLRLLGPVRHEEVARLLSDAGLPHSDLETASLSLFGIGNDDELTAIAGMERYGADALLRSVVVLGDRRGGGIGAELVTVVMAQARSQGIDRLWLLTETAAAFFERLGFARVARDSAPDAIRATTEFGQLCPASATCMLATLADR